MSKLTCRLLTAEQAAVLDRIAAKPKRHRRHEVPTWTAIDSAEALIGSDLEGDDLADAFAALPLSQQTLYVDDPRRAACLPPECCFI